MEKTTLKGLVVILLVVISISAIIYVARARLLPQFANRVAVIEIKGVLTTERPSLIPLGLTSSREIVEELDAAERDPSIKAVILDINSGGGSAVASAEIAKKIASMRKPVIAYVREVCASGAYWIASSADIIVAPPESLVGSIGAIALRADYSRLLNETLKIRYEVFKAGKYKDVYYPYRPLRNEEYPLFEEIVEEIYSEFKNWVKERRDLNESQIEEIAQGQLFTGRRARELGLVDSLGYWEDAVEKAKELAGLREVSLVYFRRPTFLERLLGGLSLFAHSPRIIQLPASLCAPRYPVLSWPRVVLGF